MNSRQLQYAVALSENLHISQTAESLNISQPALSKQILSLEEELGVTLFDRSTFPLTLTEAGESFIRDAKDILFKEERLKRSMEDFKSDKKGSLTVGISPFRALYFVSDMINDLQKKYKGLKVVLREVGSAQLHKEAVEGLVDFAIINLPVDKALLEVIPLEPEPIVLVVPKSFSNYLVSTNKSADNIYPQIDLNECGDIPFITLGKTQELRQLFDKLCITCDFVPNITTEVVGITTAWSLAVSGIGATVLPLRFIESNGLSDKIEIFSIKNSATVRQPAIVMRKGQHISKFAKEAIELIKMR